MSEIEEVPFELLSEQALRGVIEDFVTREGTEYGPIEISLETKVRQVTSQLRKGEVRITFDPKTETCNIEPTITRSPSHFREK